MAVLETVYAVHNFEAENDDELTFQIGESVIVIQKDDGFNDGWWKVKKKIKKCMKKFIIIGGVLNSKCNRAKMSEVK
jgi:hypothetical protein